MPPPTPESRQRRKPRKPLDKDQVIGILRGELGRTKQRLHRAEESLKHHTHPEHYAPSFRNGVHIDIQGNYFMHRPDGWHRMNIDLATTWPVLPVQRLAENEPPQG